MNVLPTTIPDVKIIEPRVFEDARGYFFESFSQKLFNEQVSDTVFVQDNESRSTYGVLRGLHFQKPPVAQAKLVRVVEGAARCGCGYSPWLSYLRTTSKCRA